MRHLHVAGTLILSPWSVLYGAAVVGVLDAQSIITHGCNYWPCSRVFIFKRTKFEMIGMIDVKPTVSVTEVGLGAPPGPRPTPRTYAKAV